MATSCASLISLALISGDGWVTGFGCASLSGPKDHDPRSNEQPPSRIASNAASHEVLQKALVVEKAMPAECSRVQCRKASSPSPKIHGVKKETRATRPAFESLNRRRNFSAVRGGLR